MATQPIPEPGLHAAIDAVVVTPRATPDLDGVACAIAYAELLRVKGWNARAVVEGRADGEARFVLAELGLNPATNAKADAYVLVDASDTRGLPLCVDATLVVSVIDHRLHHDAHRLFPNAAVQIEAVGAAATLVAERWRASDATPSPTAALLLQAAILSNTQGLRGSVTTPRDTEALHWLASVAPIPAALATGQVRARTTEVFQDLAGALARESKTFEWEGQPFVFSQIEVQSTESTVDEVANAAHQLGPRAMVNVVDVDAASSTLVVVEPSFRDRVRVTLAIQFQGVAAHFNPAVLRKQLVARLLGYAP
jgi:manganese-dependent inorganic pyrophosphatase